MARSDIHLDAMLRHLGAAYYDSLHGRATRTDVDRALEAVRQGLGEQDAPRGPAGPGTPASARRAGQAGHRPAGRWTRRVRDVMSTAVITADRLTPYKEIARLLAAHQISGVPVLGMGRHVIGVVTEADLLTAGKDARRAGLDAGPAGRLRWPRRARRRPGLTAGKLMTAPAVTTHPDATIPAAARLMASRHVRRLPVVDGDGKLLGIVSCRDLLAAFLRPDDAIAAEVRELLEEILREDAADVASLVRGGVVVLTGTPGPAQEADLIPVAIRLIWDIDGVVDVVSKLTTPQPATGA